MVDEGKNAGAGEGTEPKGEMISKEEFDKVQTQLTEKDAELTKVNKEHQTLKDEIFTPEYLASIEAKEKSGAPEKTPSKGGVAVTDEDLDKMSRSEFSKYMVDRISSELGPIVGGQIKALKISVDAIAANAERDKLVAKHDDASEYFDDMVKLFKQNPAYDMESAYKIAKQDRIDKKDQVKQEEAARAASEKPGGVSGGSLEPKEFKDEKSANDDAWDKAVGDKDKI